jgi:hypothetical protein
MVDDFCLTLGVLLTPDWGARAWFFVLWSLLLGQQVVQYLRRDLYRWWLMRQLLYTSEQVVLVDLIIPLIVIGLIGSGAFIIAPLIDQPRPPVIGWLFLPGVVGMGLAAAVDILLQCRSERLLSGEVPGPSLLTVLLAALVFAVPGAIAWLAASRWSFPRWFKVLAVLAVAQISLSPSYLLDPQGCCIPVTLVKSPAFGHNDRLRKA